MGKTLMFIGSEKVIKNFHRYGYESIFLPRHLIIATTKNIADNYPELQEKILFDSNWSSKDTQVLHLYFLWKNFFEKKNRALNYELRNRIFGPYKITTLKKFYVACKYLKNTLCAIHWIFFFKNYKVSNQRLLKALRENKFIGPGDVNLYKNIIQRNLIEKIVLFTPFRDPKLYDLAEACEESNCELHIFPESWDNISSGYGLPDKITKLYIWSAQQQRDLQRYYPNHAKNALIAGSYRRNYANKFIQEKNQYRDKIFRILYVEGYFYENLNFVFNKIRHALSLALIDKNIKQIEIIVRRYPLKRQTVDYQEVADWIGEFKLNDIEVIIAESVEPNLNSDFLDKSLVISELTTAGLEACFRQLPTIFIGCNKSEKFLDSVRGYKFSFAEDLILEGLFVNLNRKHDFYKFVTILSQLLTELGDTVEISIHLSNVNFYAELFDFDAWNRLISSK